MTETEHLHLKKPGQGDYYNVDDFNGNADLIDTKLKEIDDSVAQPNGIATLNASGKLAQMPTAADVGAVPSMLTDIIYVDQEEPYHTTTTCVTTSRRGSASILLP